ncbi:MAG: hypothetical protein KatS3mg005_3328 [Bryobacteraceae bacterium]|nr:MAG: hypothetical protein KatS3mg005_3328 [Bryobacteraceae bacterium]
MRAPSISCGLILLLMWAGPPAQGGWSRVLEAAGLDPSRLTVLEGDSAAARAAGFVPEGGSIEVRSVTDTFLPSLQIVWEKPVTVPRFRVPERAAVFTREKWTGAPLAAGFREGGKVVFWTAAPIGEKGYERYPYLAQALVELGLEPQAATRGLWAFFDSSYRLRADPEYLADRWRAAGISALHVAAWHYWEPDGQRDEYLRKLVAACHRRAIHVYAWIEFPHVSEAFWEAHPQWREKTATGQDAHLDWRKLMNLADPDCSAAVEAGLRNLLGRFDWDGVNLAELYFESLEGYLNPARFTPFNERVRQEFKALAGVDPADFYNPASRAYHVRDAGPMRRFLEYRARLAHRLQVEWLGKVRSMAEEKGGLDLVLTHVDDRFDTAMRDNLGADAAALLPEAARFGAAFLVEDPATIWNLGPERYAELARRYAPITPPGVRLGADINIVERYQDVYPTRQQTGGELFQLLHWAAKSFPQVAVYFENSILAPDWGLVGAAAAAARVRSAANGGIEVESPSPVAVAWQGCAEVDGQPWPVWSHGKLLVPAGRRRVTPCSGPLPPVLEDFNGDIVRLEQIDGMWRLEYESRARAIAVLSGGGRQVRFFPPGRHQVWLR